MTVRPLAGGGLATRRGDLLLVCSETGSDALLAITAEMAAARDDGAAFVRRLAALLSNDTGVLGCAAAGRTADDRLAVLVYGAATVQVRQGEERLTFSGAEAIAPVARLVDGPVSLVRLELPHAGAANPRARLDSGTVAASGLIAAPEGAVPQETEPPMVRGVLCKNDHFNDPELRYCAVCGIAMVQVTPVEQVGRRPVLGVLLVDDGTAVQLDRDYLVGSEPEQDPDVLSGRLDPLWIEDPEGAVGPQHCRLELVDWEVRVVDLGSPNGTFAYREETGWQRIAPHVPTPVEPGTVLGLGRRWLRYDSHRNP